MVAARPLIDAVAMLGRRLGAKQDQQLLRLIVLDQLAIGEAAGQAGAVELILPYASAPWRRRKAPGSRHR